MAHFHEISVTIESNGHKLGERLSGMEIPCRSINGSSVTFGLWGYLDFTKQELVVVSSLPGAVTAEKKRALGNSREWVITTSVSGQVRLEARTVAGQVWDWITLDFMDDGPADGPFTYNSNEVVTTRTTPTVRDVVQMLLTSWPMLTQAGARTLAAQFAGETGWGRYCFNWNLGNVKAGPDDPHMYLSGIWEVLASNAAQAAVKNSGGFAHLASAAEIRKNGWSAPGNGQSIAVFYPPHPMCRFRAYASLQQGAQRWVQRYQGIARRNADFLTAVNAGDVPGTAHALRQVGYYTATEQSYAAIMASARGQIDRALGPLPAAGN
jgi:hypothetical protein